MLDYLNIALPFAFPALIALILVYFAVSFSLSRVSRKWLDARQAQEEQQRRKVYAERYRPEAASEQRPADDSLLANQPIQPATNPRTSSRPFGTNFMTMADLRSRITGPSGSCTKGSCCG
ncbi:hypothetical protein EV183_001661 [Coemansia sp. RSA 2336]|nr:hypothetical protein EV183_001661 [Coemansia sp. RSA 2336]